MKVLAGIIFGFLLIRLLVSLVNYLFPTRLPSKKTGDEPLISILIPVRNEEFNIGKLLIQLVNSSYSNYEILVYDDHSTDLTGEIVKELGRGYKNIRLINGQKLPAGWLGKNHACHQLSRKARGDYFLFLDADVMTEPDLISDSISYLRKQQLVLLSIFPKQLMKSFGEKITVPLMNWILTSLLPLPLIKGSANSSLAAANGQFMLFEAANYRKNNWHEAFKNDPVEDINIMRAVKRSRLRGHTLLSNGQVSCRMYNSYEEAINGFSKNMHEFFGKSYILMSMFSLISSLGFIPVFISEGVAGLVIYLFLSMLLRLLTSLASLQNPWQNILLSPLQQIALLHVNYRSLMNKKRGYGVWKDRKINIQRT
ncbi:MAG: glycosyltransferase [Bacteroidota bacterium]